ncbi:APC family permease [Neptunomonas phycophila]|jgi:amino acid transporter|uniref:APC family permease n=1 Tax=Neptunomonas phycophila TaxID=1572645 RepID=UPI003F81640A
MSSDKDRSTQYDEGSLTLSGTVMLGTGVMIGAGIFALTGQMAEMTGALFPLAFLAAAVIVTCSAYSYIKISNAYPSAGGIGMYLHKAYGDRLPTAFNALLMYFSMVIAQSFLARTFGSYTMQLFGGDQSGNMVSILGVALILTAFVVNLLGNRLIQGVAGFIGMLKIAGILIIGLVGIFLADNLAVDFTIQSAPGAVGNFIGATALGILAFKGFTTIANSGSEVVDPHRNVGRAIVISIAACVVLYTLVGFAVASNLSLSEIIESRDYSLAAAAATCAWGIWCLVHRCHCHDGDGWRDSCQYFCSFQNVGDVDRNALGAPQPFWYAWQHPKTHSGIYRRVRACSHCIF